MLCLFTTNLAESVSFKTPQTLLVCCKISEPRTWLYRFHVQNDTTSANLCGIKQTLGAHGFHKCRLPISIVTMRLLKQYIFMSNLTNHNKLMFWSACTLAFFSFLQSSECLYFCIKLFKTQSHVALQCAYKKRTHSFDYKNIKN